MVLFSSRISPRASTSIFLDRSPWATAVATWAMLRTCEVRLSAMKLTLSVRSRQTPDTPRTWARPPRRPSVPTSRATRVTSPANADSWSTIVLMVLFSSWISLRASTLIFLSRSPLETAVATWVMLRTCEVMLSAMELTLSVRSRQTPDTPRTWARPPRRPSVPTSRATRVTSPANADSWSTIVLMVLFSSRISPRASTSIFLDRSPLATDVVTWAMLRTCEVRLSAMELTLSVRSRQTPDTPRTWARPPRRPSVPTSRATRVTSPANADSWSTIVLMVLFSSRISPRASTSIFLPRSPLATAVATWAMLRTCEVRLSAMELTLSVRSRQTPDTPRTWARPPRRPSVPTSRATRVTSPANADSWSTIVLIVLFSSRISPRASTSIFLDRSPLATDVVTWAMLRTCEVRLSAMELTLSVRSRQTPDTPRTWARPPRRPSVPTSRATRVTSPANADSWSTIVLMVLFSSRISPRASTSIFLDRSPLATDVVTWAMLRTCEVRLSAMELTLSVRSRQTPDTPRTWARPPRRPSVPTSRATRVTSPANADSWSTIVLIVLFSSMISPRASTSIFLDRSPLATDVVTWAMLRTCEVRLSAMEL